MFRHAIFYLMILVADICIAQQDLIIFNGFDGGISANLISLTRVDGISPETIYFSAEN